MFMLRGGSRTAATSTMEHFVIIVNSFHSLTFVTKCSILDVAAVLDPSLGLIQKQYLENFAFLILAVLEVCKFLKK